jgi:hypothetical protein
MKQLVRTDLKDIAEYELERPEFRAHTIEMKKHRRVHLGEHLTLVFENRETVRFQIQEMMRVERIVIDERVQEELDTYNQLLPEANELSATLLIEIADQAHLREILDRYIGIDHGPTTFLVIGGDRVIGEYEGGRSTEIRVSAVHYVRFKLTAAQAAAFADSGVAVSFAVDHPAYQGDLTVADDIRASLAQDLVAD